VAISEENERNASIARRIYIDGANAAREAAEWIQCHSEIRAKTEVALTASNNMRNIVQALQSDGSHMLVMRHLLAPPKSQDQFALLCDDYSKAAEKSGRGYNPEAATAVENALLPRIDPLILPWLSEGRAPSDSERHRLVERVVSLIAPKQTETRNRNRLSAEQEGAVVSLLKELGWAQFPSVTIDTRAAIPPRTFMHKTRFATATTAAQEVDIACGLANTVVAAMECKVTNDPTNSVKRVNDVLKKAKAWKDRYGDFVETAALLQGVIKASDVQRLTDDGVRVFWSHDLDSFAEWIESRV
jgi:hypothetical protein